LRRFFFRRRALFFLFLAARRQTIHGVLRRPLFSSEKRRPDAALWLMRAADRTRTRTGYQLPDPPTFSLLDRDGGVKYPRDNLLFFLFSFSLSIDAPLTIAEPFVSLVPPRSRHRSK
jgi:hypothetical protein